MKLIDKDVLVAEIERLWNEYKNSDGDDNKLTWFVAKLENFVNTLELKGVDYERELSKYVSNGIHRFFPNVDDDYCKMDSVIWQDYVIETAEHFFELGMLVSNKAQKGEEV